MRCPKCKRENHDQAQICLYCRSSLIYIPEIEPKPDVRTSRLAIASAILAVLSIPGFIIFSGPTLYGPNPAYRYAYSQSLSIFAQASFLSAVLALFLSLAALACIEINYGRLAGRAFAAIGLSIPLIGCCLTTARVTLGNVRGTAYRLVCGSNLSGIGKAMLVYSNDYDDELPRAGGPNSKWGSTPNWQANTAAEAYGLNDGPGRASMSANFYLLVKYAEVAPKSFRCAKEPAFKEFKLADYRIRDKDVVDVWDFGPDPAKHVSFSYHVPYGSYALTTANDPGMAVAADRNPWLRTPSRRVRPASDFRNFDPNGTRQSIRRANAPEHDEDGQNVLFLDGHTTFEKLPFCGVNDDNIYTPQTATDIRKGALPTITSQPANKTDSLLLHDPPKGAKK